MYAVNVLKTELMSCNGKLGNKFVLALILTAPKSVVECVVCGVLADIAVPLEGGGVPTVVHTVMLCAATVMVEPLCVTVTQTRGSKYDLAMIIHEIHDRMGRLRGAVED